MGLDITGLGAVFEFGSKIIDKIFPDKTEAEKIKLSMYEMQMKGELQELNNIFLLAVEQAKINSVEAASSSVWVSGWRPFIGWICGSALAYNYILMPLTVYIAAMINPEAPPMPALDSGELVTLLFGMLGIGAMRSYDKQKDASQCGKATG